MPPHEQNECVNEIEPTKEKYIGNRIQLYSSFPLMYLSTPIERHGR